MDVAQSHLGLYTSGLVCMQNSWLRPGSVKMKCWRSRMPRAHCTFCHKACIDFNDVKQKSGENITLNCICIMDLTNRLTQQTLIFSLWISCFIGVSIWITRESSWQRRKISRQGLSAADAAVQSCEHEHKMPQWPVMHSQCSVLMRSNKEFTEK